MHYIIRPHPQALRKGAWRLCFPHFMYKGPLILRAVAGHTPGSWVQRVDFKLQGFFIALSVDFPGHEMKE